MIAASLPLLLLLLALLMPLACSLNWKASIAQTELAKSKLRQALRENEGRTAAPAVAAVIDELAVLQSSRAPLSGELLAGRSRALSSLEFYGCLGRNSIGNAYYTLGRLAFNAYHPVALQCAVTNVFQPIVHNEGDISYDIDISFTAEPDPSGPALRGRIIHHAVATFSHDFPSRLLISFVAGTMFPADDNEDLDLWLNTFQGQKRSKKCEVITDLHVPGSMSDDGRLNYVVKRPLVGHLDVLFVDDELRITKGNMGSVVVVERL